jgi:hypothetical protein
MFEDPNSAENDERLQALEANVKDLALLFKYLVDSSPHGESFCLQASAESKSRMKRC